jgi:branched-chain amino acid transport system ATP-binding protein
MTVLAVERLGKSFGGVRAAANISFAVAAGELVALIGPNGAGKSTTFNLIGGQLRPDEGTVRLGGENITGLPPRQIWRKGVGRTFQIAQTFVSMSVVENVQMALISARGETRAPWRPAASRRRAEALALLDTIGMVDQAERACAVLAYADIKRVELAIALASEPKLLLMDEPTAGMALKDRATLMDLVAAIARGRGIAVLFTEHDMNAVFRYADRIHVLVRGEIVASGDPETLRSDTRLKEVYLGSHALPPAGRVTPVRP